MKLFIWSPKEKKKCVNEDMPVLAAPPPPVESPFLIKKVFNFDIKNVATGLIY
jgi:hypothetical protein